MATEVSSLAPREPVTMPTGPAPQPGPSSSLSVAVGNDTCGPKPHFHSLSTLGANTS